MVVKGEVKIEEMGVPTNVQRICFEDEYTDHCHCHCHYYCYYMVETIGKTHKNIVNKERKVMTMTICVSYTLQ